jgi:hypothetical protein
MSINHHILLITVNDFITEIKQKLTERTSADRNGEHVLQDHVKCRGLWDNLAARVGTKLLRPPPHIDL